MQDPTVDLIKTTIHSTIHNLIPTEFIKESEIDAIIEICMMTTNPTGKEKPRKLMSEISDILLKSMIIQLPKIQNTIFGKVSSLFIVEWCYRNHHLECDWYWKWISPRKGKLFYQSKLPIEQIELPNFI